MKNITSAQIRAGRALLRWSAQDLAEKASLGVATIRRAELAEDKPTTTAANLLAIANALEGAGVVFMTSGETVEGGPGVRLSR